MIIVRVILLHLLSVIFYYLSFALIDYYRQSYKGLSKKKRIKKFKKSLNNGCVMIKWFMNNKYGCFMLYAICLFVSVYIITHQIIILYNREPIISDDNEFNSLNSISILYDKAIYDNTIKRNLKNRDNFNNDSINIYYDNITNTYLLEFNTIFDNSSTIINTTVLKNLLKELIFTDNNEYPCFCPIFIGIYSKLIHFNYDIESNNWNILINPIINFDSIWSNNHYIKTQLNFKYEELNNLYKSLNHGFIKHSKTLNINFQYMENGNHTNKNKNLLEYNKNIDITLNTNETCCFVHCQSIINNYP